MNKKDLKNEWLEKSLAELREQVEWGNEMVQKFYDKIDDSIKEMQELDKTKKTYLSRMKDLSQDIQYYVKEIKSWQEILEVLEPILNERNEEENIVNEIEEPKFEVIKKFIEEWKENAINWHIAQGKDKKEIRVIFEQEAKNRLIKLIKQIKEKTGEVLECKLYTNSQSNGFDGVIKGVKNTVNIQTILAGGYNIQELHVRVLIK